MNLELILPDKKNKSIFRWLSDVSAAEFYGNGLEKEAERTIRKFGKRIPAKLHSRTIGAYTEEMIHFIL